MIANLIGGFIAIIVGASLIGPVADQIEAATTGNVTGWAATVADLTTGFFALGLMATGVAVCYSALRTAGII